MKPLASALSFSFIAFLVPMIASAQVSGGGTFNGSAIGGYLQGIVTFINSYVIPFIFAIAFIVFIWGVFQYFIAGGANEEQRDKGKQLVFWGIIGFVVMITVWGIINLLVASTNLKEQNKADLPKFTWPSQGS